MPIRTASPGLLHLLVAWSDALHLPILARLALRWSG
jgi:hypothetical protein